MLPRRSCGDSLVEISSVSILCCARESGGEQRARERDDGEHLFQEMMVFCKVLSKANGFTVVPFLCVSQFEDITPLPPSLLFS